MIADDDNIKAFRIEVAEVELTELRERLARTRWPHQVPGTGWDAGTDGTYLRQLCAYWQTDFDWRVVERQLNSHPNFVTQIDGQRIHFLHVRSAKPDAMPLLLSHGWPGSVLEFMKVIGPLTDPVRFGGTASDAFHVVCPSLPGFGWSGPTNESGWDTSRIAKAFAVLMSRLGYERFAAQGGDLGAAVTSHLGVQVPDRLVGIHLNVAAVPPVTEWEPTQQEQQILAEWQAYTATEVGYIAMQRTKPQTLAYGLTDSPVGLAAWIVEKFRRWTDCDGDVESAMSRDEMLADITAYWLTETIGSSMRLYYEAAIAGGALPSEYVDVPCAFAIFPHEMYQASERWARRQYNVQRWTEMARGGHFAALEQPELLVRDVRAFFRAARRTQM